MITIDGADKLGVKLKDFVAAFQPATKLAMNEASRKARTGSLRKTREGWNIKAKSLKSYTSMKPATNNRMEILFTIKSGGIPLKEFAMPGWLAKTREEQRATKGVSYKVKKGGGARAKPFKGAFVEKSISRGTKFVLVREGESRYPLVPLTVVSPTYMFEQAEGVAVFERIFKENFVERWDHQMKRYLK